ncbi:MAG: MarR family winged helix-turn-helix transcriptional regulator [Muribaculaceae bacterium]|nr:MarR family winged helix-turn-helix transcriptional regulator [Muribaculaceae bacterium]MDE7369128.1 MarR family winged helix-turn-helix transcriptional regulator [Muribaculaceae bacterium]
MKTEKKTYQSPALGCMLGSANQILLVELERALKEAKLSLTTVEYLVLRALYSKDGIRQCEIGDMVGRDKAGICRCVTGLIKKGLVITEPVSYKCLKVYLTDKARLIQPKVMQVAESRHQGLVDLLTPEELNVFNKVLEKIIITKSK